MTIDVEGVSDAALAAYGYPECPDDVQLLWYKDLVPQRDKRH
jgi:hypothetical protein